MKNKKVEQRKTQKIFRLKPKLYKWSLTVNLVMDTFLSTLHPS